MTWTDRAACRGTDPTLFFPDVQHAGDIQAYAGPIARRYCHPCPVRADCLTEARRVRREHAGVWGLWAGIWWRTGRQDVPLLPALRGAS